MRTSLCAATAALFVSASLSAAQTTPERVRFVLTSLAHDSMEGRAMGTRGSMRAARFIAEQFRLAGLTPAGDSGYFQHVPLWGRSVNRSSSISVDGTRLELGTDFSVGAGRADPRSIDGVQVVYGGVRGGGGPVHRR